MYRLGIDPGVTGALCLLNEELTCLVLQDMPTMLLSNKKHQVNPAELGKLLASWKDRAWPLTAYLERVSARPGQGVAGMFNFGVSYGIVQGILGELQVPMELISPVTWKKRAGLQGTPKDRARTLAQQLYPYCDLARKKDVGRADALLIARFGEA